MHKTLFRGSKDAAKIFGVAAVVLTLSVGVAYGVGQQVLRSSANDPQVEITEGVADALNQGQDPQAFGSLAPVDLEKSLSPFVIVLDQDGKVIAGTAMLDGQTPTPPSGVVDAAKAKGENRLTWEPKPKVRVAAVVKPYSFKDASSTTSVEGFVLAGKSLREVDARAQNLLILSGVSLAAGLVVVLLAVNVLYGKKEEHNHPEGEHHHAA